MKLPAQEKAQLERLCAQFRLDVVEALYQRQTGHPGGSLSVCEILAVLYFKEMTVDPTDPINPDRDRLVLSKGHAAPMLYRVLAEKGFFPAEELKTLRCINSRLQGHPCSLSTPGIDATSGPLGLGLSCALGMAMALKMDRSPARVYAVLGDGELNEGNVWEAMMAAAKYKADNLCAVVDWNQVQLDGTLDEVMPMDNLSERFRVFGWHCIEADGHDLDQLCGAFEQARTVKGMPTVILARTVKGKGISFMEGQAGWHGKAIDQDSYRQAVTELGGVH